jgi:hypothetical protein
MMRVVMSVPIPDLWEGDPQVEAPPFIDLMGKRVGDPVGPCREGTPGCWLIEYEITDPDVAKRIMNSLL